MKKHARVAAGIIAVLLAMVAVAFVIRRRLHARRGHRSFAVGPHRDHKSVGSLTPDLGPGDTLTLEGGVDYPAMNLEGSGTALEPIRVVGTVENGKRPRFASKDDRYTLAIRGEHILVEGVEVTGGRLAAVFVEGNDVTIRDSEVHDCASHGILASDTNSGSLTLERVDVHHAGSGDRRHQIYVATDQAAYPQATFRLLQSRVHDGLGGNAVKSRAERNEIRGSTIEGAYYQALDLIGPEIVKGKPRPTSSDIVDNVIRGNGHEHYHLVRLGGDEEATSSDGDYRFTRNRFEIENEARSVVRVTFGAHLISFEGNVFSRTGSGTTPVLDLSDATGAEPTVQGVKNEIGPGFSGVPRAFR